VVGGGVWQVLMDQCLCSRLIMRTMILCQHLPPTLHQHLYVVSINVAAVFCGPQRLDIFQLSVHLCLYTCVHNRAETFSDELAINF